MLTILNYNGYFYYNAKLYSTAVPAEWGRVAAYCVGSVLRTAGTAYCGTAAQHVGGKRDQVKIQERRRRRFLYVSARQQFQQGL